MSVGDCRAKPIDPTSSAGTWPVTTEILTPEHPETNGIVMAMCLCL